MNDKYFVVGSDSSGSNLQLYLLENDTWVYKNQANVPTAYRNYNNQATNSYNNISLYGNRVIIGSINNTTHYGARGGVICYHLDSTDGIVYKNENPGYDGYFPSFNGNEQYKYYGNHTDLHKHVLFIHGDSRYTYAYWS